MPVARCVMPVPENFQTGKCPFARCPKKIKRANARCPLPDYSCPLASLKPPTGRILTQCHSREEKQQKELIHVLNLISNEIN